MAVVILTAIIFIARVLKSFVPSTDDEITEMAISLAESPEYLCEKNLESFISKYPKDYTNSMTSLCENKKRNVFDFELKGFEDCNAVQIYEVISNPFSLSVSLKDHQSTNILGINSEAINTLYHKLVQTKTRLFNGILFLSLRTLCWCFETLIKSNQDVPLRAIPFLLLHPLLGDPRCYHLSPIAYADVVRLNPISRKVIESYIQSEGPLFVSTLLYQLQNNVTIALLTNNDLRGQILHNSSISSVLDMIQFLFLVNRKMKPSLSSEKFTNETIAERLDRNYELSRDCLPPACLPTDLKVDIVKRAHKMKRTEMFREAAMRHLFVFDRRDASLFLNVRRTNLLEDSLLQLERHADRAALPLMVSFSGEDGVDAGGLTREWFKLITEQVFNPIYGMFVSKNNYSWFFSSASNENDFRLIGMVIGLALYNGVLIDVRLPPVLFKKLLGYKLELKDLADLDPSIYRSLYEILTYEETQPHEIEEIFGLNFQITYEEYGVTKTVDLIENAANVLVTKENRAYFVERYVTFLLVDSIRSQYEPFCKGFNSVISSEQLSEVLFPDELHAAICGTETLDLNDLRERCKYKNGYTPRSPTILNFWRVVSEFDAKQKRQFLEFLTGSPRAPFGGLGRLDPPLAIERHGGDDDRLPSSSTCFNLLHLPPYASYEKLKEKLTKAIQNTDGFFLV